MTLSELEKEKLRILKEIESLGDMRSGSLSTRYQRCSKSPCVCNDPKHPGHGPIYSFSVPVNGKTHTRNYKLDSELTKLNREIENYQAFKKLSKELIDISNQICDLRPVSDIKDEDELAELKKKLHRQFMKKYKEK